MHRDELERRLLDGDHTDQTVAAEPDLAAAVEAELGASALKEYQRIRSALSVEEVEDATPRGGWAAFEQRLSGTLDDLSTGSGAAGLRCGGRLSIARWGWPLATAASLLLAVGIAVTAYLGETTKEDATGSGVASVSPTSLLPTREEAANKMRVFQEVSGAFDRQVDWIAESGVETAMGLSRDAVSGADAGAANDRRLLLLRLTLIRDGAVVSQTDVILAGGRDAELTLPLPNGRRVTYQIDTAAPDEQHRSRLSLWAEVGQAGRDAQTIAALATQLALTPGQTMPAGQISTNGDRYELQVGFREVDLEGAAGDRREPGAAANGPKL